MRLKKDGTRFFMDESIQRQAEIARQAGKESPTPRGAWLSLTRQYLGDVELFARRCRVDEAIPVAKVRQELRNLIEYLETNKT